MDFSVRSLPGLVSFQEVYELQLRLLEQRIRNEIPDTFIFCEHNTVITRGRGLQLMPGRTERQTPLLFLPPETEYVETTRGGDLTWHGPGQLVLYPIIKLGGEGTIGKSLGQDINRYIRFLEQVWIDLLLPFGIHATTKAHGSGVWVGEQKLASVGIALRRWVTYHGIAMNVVNDPNAFRAFSPCGFESEVMTRLKDQPQIRPENFFSNWRPLWEKRVIESLRAAHV